MPANSISVQVVYASGAMDSRREAMVEVSRRIGGVEQRAAFAAQPIHADFPCMVADELELLFAWGAIQANLIQRLCGAIVLDDERVGNQTHPRVKRLASIGTFGFHGAIFGEICFIIGTCPWRVRP